MVCSKIDIRWTRPPFWRMSLNWSTSLNWTHTCFFSRHRVSSANSTDSLIMTITSLGFDVHISMSNRNKMKTFSFSIFLFFKHAYMDRPCHLRNRPVWSMILVDTSLKRKHFHDNMLPSLMHPLSHTDAIKNKNTTARHIWLELQTNNNFLLFFTKTVLLQLWWNGNRIADMDIRKGNLFACFSLCPKFHTRAHAVYSRCRWWWEGCSESYFNHCSIHSVTFSLERLRRSRRRDAQFHVYSAVKKMRSISWAMFGKKCAD